MKTTQIWLHNFIETWGWFTKLYCSTNISGRCGSPCRKVCLASLQAQDCGIHLTDWHFNYFLEGSVSRFQSFHRCWTGETVRLAEPGTASLRLFLSESDKPHMFIYFPYCLLIFPNIQWVDLRENLNRKPSIFPWDMGFSRFIFPEKPLNWNLVPYFPIPNQ